MSYSFKEVSEAEITPFFESHKQGSFAQSVSMAKVREHLGRTIHYIAVFKGKKIVAGAQLSLLKGRVQSADITAGPLLDYSDAPLLAFFTKEIRAYLAAKGIAYLTISPYIPYTDETVKALKALGWNYSGRIDGHAVGIRGNIRWIYVKDLAGQTIDTFRTAYAKRHRRYIKNSDPRLSLRRLSRDELPLFLSVMAHTAERRHFTNRNDDYFYALYDSFGDKAHFVIVELDATTPVAGIVFLESNQEVVSFLGGAVEEYAKYRGTYLLHDHMIEYAIKQGYDRYNFYGIEGKINDPTSEGYGIYEFKSRFGTGQAVELIGEFVLPIKKLPYTLFKLLSR